MLVLWAIFGLLGGSVAYRVADRLLEPDGVAAAGWLPRCARCGRLESPLRRIGLIALAFRLECQGCGLRPPLEQGLVEVVTAGLVVALHLRAASPVPAGIYVLATIVLVALTLTDLRERLIPNVITYPATVLALGASLLPGAVGPLEALGGALAAGAIALGVWALGRVLYRRGDVFGLGDVKLAVFIGAVLGLARALDALILGVFVGGLIAVGLIVSGRSRRTTMPYGPALAAGAYLTMLIQP